MLWGCYAKCGETVSNTSVRLARLSRGLRYGLLALLSTVGLAIAYIPIQQQILRRRAEHLLAEVQQLGLRTSAWSDAQSILGRWGRWGHYDGACTPQHCSFLIEFGNVSNTNSRVAQIVQHLEPVYRFFGGRRSLVKAGVTVEDGLVWEKGFSLFVQVPPGLPPNTHEYTLIGAAWSTSQLRVAPPSLADHPNYTVVTPAGCLDCLAVEAEFTPYADQRDVARLMQFNLLCLTSRRPCREKSEIMPSAWSQYSKDAAGAHLLSAEERCSQYGLKVLGRDTQNAAIVDVVANHIDHGTARAFQVSTVRLIKGLKAASFWAIGETKEVRVFEGSVGRTSRNQPSDLIPGARFIFLFSHRHSAGPTGPEVWLDSCGALPFTEENLSQVQRGIDEDYFATKRREN